MLIECDECSGLLLGMLQDGRIGGTLLPHLLGSDNIVSFIAERGGEPLGEHLIQEQSHPRPPAEEAGTMSVRSIDALA